jgi:voltage-dependent calcium channel L type alpha-1D|tara:strand:- start:2244 stop:2351 length:108 start_codon:yes stop_codon:yes gene_type:complete
MKLILTFFIGDLGRRKKEEDEKKKKAEDLKQIPTK